MTIWKLLCLGILAFMLSGCFGKDRNVDDEHETSSSKSSLSSSATDSSAVSTSSEVINSSNANISSSAIPPSSSAESTSSVVINVSSSSVFSSVIPPSSSVASTSSVIINVSSASVSSSEIPLSSSSISSSESSSSVSSSESSSSVSSSESSSSSSVTMIEDLSFSDTLDTDQSVQTDSIENLGAILIGLVDQEAYHTFYSGLIAQGLDEAAVAKAISVLPTISTAIAADFIKALSGQALLPAPEGINLVANVMPIGNRGVEYGYSLNQAIDGVNVVLDIALRFETQRPTLSALIDGRTGYSVFLDGLQLIGNELSLSTSEVILTLDSTTPLIASANLLVAEAELTQDGSAIVGVTFSGQSLSLNLKSTLVNGIIGVNTSTEGDIDNLDVTLDLESGASSIEVIKPNININMQGVDTEG